MMDCDYCGEMRSCPVCIERFEVELERDHQRDIAEAARRLHAAGYRQVSRKYQTIARVDRPLWRWAQENGYTRIDEQRQAELYRRVYSPDRIANVPEPVMQILRQLGI